MGINSGGIVPSDNGGGGSSATSGTYTPVRSNEINLDTVVIPGIAFWMRIDNVVFVSGDVAVVDPELVATVTSFELTIPIASNFSAESDASGDFTCGSIAGMGGAVKASIANNTIVVFFISSSLTSETWSYQAMYIIK